MGEMVEVIAENGTATGYLAVPQEGQGPGVLLMHAWWGLNGFFKDLAERLADEGFVVLAPDLYDGRTASTIPEAEALVTALEEDGGEKALAKEQAALNYFINSPALTGSRIAAIGFSMGAAYASWLAALRPEVAAVVLFYGGVYYGGGGGDYADYTNAAFLGHFAENDEYESFDTMRELESQLRLAGKQAAFHVYPGTRHWFFENDRPEYDPQAAQIAWERTVEFLRATLG